MKDMTEARRRKLIEKAHALLDEAEKCIKVIVDAAMQNNKKAA